MDKTRATLANLARAAEQGAASDDDAHTIGVGDVATLTAKQDLFAKFLAETGNQAAAYRKAYNVGERTLPQSIWASASKIAAFPQVRARVRYYQEQAALETILSARELFAWCVDVATADPNDIVRVVARCCRHCYGNNYEYQWVNSDEYLSAQVRALDDQAKSIKTPMPNDVGGYGFNGALEPNPICPHCYGVGHAQTIIADTTKLTGKARKLYAGAEEDRFGAIKVKLHDQKAYAEMAGRILGAFNDKLDLRSPSERAAAESKAKIPTNVTEEQAAKAYLEMLGK